MKSVLILIAVFFIVRALKNSLEAKKSVRAAPTGPPPQKEPPFSAKKDAEEMALDPVCGSYVPLSSAVRASEGGRTVHFCSEECREKYSPEMGS